MAFIGERKRLEGDVCGKDLQRALWTDPPALRLMPGIHRKLDSVGRTKIKKDCDEVYPGIILGTGDSIKDLDYLLDLQITHIINYAKQGICYKGFVCRDLPAEPISNWFEECATFIERALSMRCGKVFICCYMGNSRSATIAAAYLMLKQNFSATQALQYMRGFREVQPNLGFLQQLAEKDNTLRKDRYRKYEFNLKPIQYGI